MAKRPRERTAKMRQVVSLLMDKGVLGKGRNGMQVRVARFFGVSPQAIANLVSEERRKRGG